MANSKSNLFPNLHGDAVGPVEGGVENNYVYPPDPVNDFDLDGTFGWKNFATLTSVGSFVPGPIGMVSSAVSAAAYAKAGDKRNAILMASGIALAGVGAAGAVRAFQAAKVVKTTPVAAKAVKGSYSVYHGYDKAGVVRYVGITKRNPIVRFREHRRSPERIGLDFKVVKSGLSRNAARYKEQSYIDLWGMQKNGGQLLNKINSIRKR